MTTIRFAFNRREIRDSEDSLGRVLLADENFRPPRDGFPVFQQDVRSIQFALLDDSLDLRGERRPWRHQGKTALDEVLPRAVVDE